MAILGASLIPSHRIKRGMSAKGGVTRKASKMRCTLCSAFGKREKSSPKKMPLEAASRKPQSERAAEAIVCERSSPEARSLPKVSTTAHGDGNNTAGTAPVVETDVQSRSRRIGLTKYK